jgi:hypothetical protein
MVIYVFGSADKRHRQINVHETGQLKAGGETSVVPGAYFFCEIRPEAFRV